MRYIIIKTCPAFSIQSMGAATILKIFLHLKSEKNNVYIDNFMRTNIQMLLLNVAHTPKNNAPSHMHNWRQALFT